MRDERGGSVMETVLICGAVIFVALAVLPAIANSAAAQLEEKRALHDATRGLADVAVISTRATGDVARLQAVQALMPWLVLLVAGVAITIALAIVAVCVVAFLCSRQQRPLSEPLFPRVIIDVPRRQQLRADWRPVSIRERDRQNLQVHAAHGGRR